MPNSSSPSSDCSARCVSILFFASSLQCVTPCRLLLLVLGSLVPPPAAVLAAAAAAAGPDELCGKPGGRAGLLPLVLLPWWPGPEVGCAAEAPALQQQQEWGCQWHPSVTTPKKATRGTRGLLLSSWLRM
jgi:hypothetical protein